MRLYLATFYCRGPLVGVDQPLAAELFIIIAAIQESDRKEFVDDCKIHAINLPTRWLISPADVGTGPFYSI
ncbi:lupus la ribonucleoprotein [Culex quinquefasciatus]|uniref:Lupus la ribonucleoprotein n=1 Tax=Culex quinquefasciatus TaxID=7176 RepID=B0WIT7_CULQU|nr:lupus la ribonucleoprotein [Culex quinquefasciatus]|eukprot:XP_001848621.1 lupus la ribonucleoprotein [Culex quinquefasciatus]